MRMKLLIIFLLVYFGINAQIISTVKNLGTSNSGYDFFSSENILKVSLRADFTKFWKSAKKINPQTAEFIFYTEDSIQISQQVEIKARGKNRLENCAYPPIKMVFPEKSADSLNSTEFSLKMVAECKSGPKYSAYLLKEYLCYKLYHFLTDTSFRVRLLELTYIDTGSKKHNERTVFAFFIENEKMLAKRLNVFFDKRKNLTQRSVEKGNILRLAMFHFMIGNFDWAVPTRQNLSLIYSRLKRYELYAVPYDFDYCGLVNAEYAIPNEALGIETVTERIYLGECMPKEEYIPVIGYFDAKKSGFYELISGFDYLSERDKSQTLNYLDEFYQIIHSPIFYKKYILSTCKEIR